MAQQNAISPTRAQDFPEWYQQVIKAADLAENSEVRGCMVIKPWGYAIWELIHQQLVSGRGVGDPESDCREGKAQSQLRGK